MYAAGVNGYKDASTASKKAVGDIYIKYIQI